MALNRRISTGISGLDSMLKGGLIEGRPYAVMGGPGAGKSILGWQFLHEGAIKGEQTLYVTLDEPHDEIRANMDSLDMMDPSIKIMDLSPEDVEKDGDISSLTYLDQELPAQLLRFKPTRVVLDSTTSIRTMEPDAFRARRRILSIMRVLSSVTTEEDHPITSVLITETNGTELPVEGYLTRGVIRLHSEMVKGVRVRAISIDKMRGGNFDEHLRPIRIGKGGIYVAAQDTIIIG
ncbi:MAG: ATPase domain-containing protein [Candidatus Thermoplasmatota archaeon]|nr:ATPase domain-containing protein [Candidatus Thermoplasmatota archaeon]